MKKKYAEYWLQFKTNKLFRSTLHTYFVIACMVFLAYALVMVFNVYNAASSQMKSAHAKMLSQAETTADFIMRNVSSTANLTFENSTDAINAVTKPYDPLYSTAVSNVISQMKSTSNAIDKVYFFNLTYDCIYTGENPVYTSKDFPDQELLQMISETDHYNVNEPHVLKYDNGQELTEKNTIVSIYKYNNMGSMAVFIDSDLFNSMVNTDSKSKKQTMTIMQSDGTVISASDPSLFGTNMSDNKTVKKILSLKNDSGAYSTLGKVYCYKRSDTLNSLYVSTFNTSSVIVSYVWQFLTIIMFAFLLVCLYFISSMQMSESFFRPFKDLRKNLFDVMEIDNSAAKELVGSDADLALISKNLKEIKKEYNSMQTTEYLYSASRQNELVYSILTGAYNFDKANLDDYNIHFKYPYNTVLVLRLDNTALLERSNVGLILYGIANTGTEICTQPNISAFSTTYADEYDVVFILNHSSQKLDERYIEMIQKLTKNIFDVTVSAAYASDEGNIDSISDLYQCAKYAMQYRLVRGHNSVISYTELRNKELSVKHDYPEKLAKNVIREINSRNENGMNDAVNDFINAIADMPYTYIIIHSCVLMMDISSHSTNDKGTSSERALTASALMKMEVIDEIKDAIISLAKDALISVSDIKLDDKHVIIANSIETYIKEHYTDPNLSIDIIAAHVNKSPNYTRSIFKQQKGISISDFITKIRFDEVCRLLIETNMTAQAIGQKTGLNSGSYFYTAFKKYTGYTPEQYRKKHMSI